MKTTYLFIAGLISLSTNAVFAAETTTPALKPCQLSLNWCRRAQGEEVGMEGMIWYEAQKTELAKANAAKKKLPKLTKISTNMIFPVPEKWPDVCSISALPK
jgi:hypothetical protein